LSWGLPQGLQRDGGQRGSSSPAALLWRVPATLNRPWGPRDHFQGLSVGIAALDTAREAGQMLVPLEAPALAALLLRWQSQATSRAAESAGGEF